MSRKFERQVARNTKKVNAQRKRLGQSSIDETARGITRIVGRSWILASFLAMVGILYMVMFWGVSRNGMYWLTVGLYLGLAFIVFFWRRPFLTIEKNTLTTRKFAGYRTIQASEIEEIETQKGYVVISLKGKRSKVVFSRTMQRFDTDHMADLLENYARTYQVKFTKV